MILTKVTTVKDVHDFDSNIDKEFMIECSKVDENRPQTWAKYGNDFTSIVTMEYNELMKPLGKEQKIREVYHLSTALLNLWRQLKNEESK